ncbi:MAG TPA: hypothetical protein VGD67_27840 [Pseudonocardiaceae bacterium]
MTHPQYPQHYPPAAPAAGYGPQPGWGRIVVDCSYTSLSFLLAATGPTVMVDGQPRGWQWGATVIDVPAGTHHVHAHTRYMGQIGKADASVPVGPGQLVTMYYRAPLTVFSKGRFTGAPQSAPGMGAMIALVAVPIAVVLLVVLIAILAA